MEHTIGLIDYREKAEKAKGTYLSDVFDGISSRQDSDGYVSLTTDSVREICDRVSEEQRSLLAHDGGYRSLDEARANVSRRVVDGLRVTRDSAGYPKLYMDSNYRGDIYRNVYFSPQEASNIYSSCGLPTHIIDKKASAVFLNGLSFRCAGIEQDRLAEFADYAQSSGFFDQCATALTQALVYGGAMIYPVFKQDNPYTFLEGFDITDNRAFSERLRENGMPTKGFVQEFAVVDRWNTVIVPEYSPMARDYLMAGAMFIPIDGITLNTSRASLMRWKKTSYWESLRYMGWCPSDFSGWIDAYLQYRVMQDALPKMAMQSSLLYSFVPIDSVLMQNGTDDVRELQRLAQEALDEINVNQAKIFNSIGELKTVDRTYTGFKDILQENRIGLCADAGLPVSVVFEDAPRGLASDREDDILLKKAEVVKRIWNNISTEVRKQAIVLGYDFFGADSDEAGKLGNLVVESYSHVPETTQQKAQVANAFADTISKLSIAGIAPKDGIRLVERFFPEIPMTKKQEEDLDRTFSEIQNVRYIGGKDAKDRGDT